MILSDGWPQVAPYWPAEIQGHRPIAYSRLFEGPHIHHLMRARNWSIPCEPKDAFAGMDWGYGRLPLPADCHCLPWSGHKIKQEACRIFTMSLLFQSIWLRSSRPTIPSSFYRPPHTETDRRPCIHHRHSEKECIWFNVSVLLMKPKLSDSFYGWRILCFSFRQAPAIYCILCFGLA